MSRREISRYLIGVIFIVAGINHFWHPHFYEQIVPPWVPMSAGAAVWISGIAEVAGGVGMLIPATSRAAAWGLIALLIAVFPANLYMWYADVAVDGNRMPWYFHAIRLPFQAVIIYWVYQHTRARRQRD